VTISKILTINQVCELLNVRPGWIYARTCDGTERGIGRGRPRREDSIRPHPIELIERMPHFKCGRLLRFDRDEVLAWFQAMHRDASEPSVNQPEGALQPAESQASNEAR
jgi:predicted DNA-binding transcriptional regulator AlpA